MQKDFVWKPSISGIKKESDVHPHVDIEKAHLFEVADSSSTEYEVLNWIHATIRVLKPQLVLETGAFNGIGTVAMAHACKLNGFGKVHSLEIDPKCCANVNKTLQDEYLSDYAEVHQCHSLGFLRNTDLIFDIGFFDSAPDTRTVECHICLTRSILTKVAVLHDTSPYRLDSAPDYDGGPVYRNKILELAKLPMVSGYYDSPLSRGFMALFLKQIV